jgi:hypothetical protein
MNKPKVYKKLQFHSSSNQKPQSNGRTAESPKEDDHQWGIHEIWKSLENKRKSAIAKHEEHYRAAYNTTSHKVNNMLILTFKDVKICI